MLVFYASTERSPFVNWFGLDIMLLFHCKTPTIHLDSFCPSPSVLTFNFSDKLRVSIINRLHINADFVFNSVDVRSGKGSCQPSHILSFS